MSNLTTTTKPYKIVIFATCLFLLAITGIEAQVGIGTTTPSSKLEVVGAGTTSATTSLKVGNASSTILTVRNDGLVEVSSTTQGFLPPRMTYAQREAIASPATGSIIYCTNCGSGQAQVYDGTAWANMIGGTGLTQPPTVASTTAVSNISKTTFTSGGNITTDFGNAITARGVCWSTSPTPTTAGSKTTESGTTGTFSSNVTGLNAGTLYYIRAYATNASGTSYGNQVTVRTTDYAIGESALGGKIAYLLQPGDFGYDANTSHGLVAAVADFSTAPQWGCMGSLISGADGITIGTGNQNTIDIVNGCNTAGIAARLCYDLVEGGYSDWYLPSIDELEKLYISKSLIGGFAQNLYWSSTEYDSNSARMHYFNLNVPVRSYNAKDQPNMIYVRAIRAF